MGSAVLKSLENPVHYIFPQFALALEDADLTEHVRSLPRFLRKFTVGSVLAYALTKCVDLLEKRRKYEEATALLRTLLAQAGLLWISECHPPSFIHVFDDYVSHSIILAT